MRIYILFIVFICLLYSPSLLATDIKFKTFGVEDGLANESSYKLIQDNEGYIWIATYNGLNRFDGVNFKTYKSDVKDTNSIPGNIIMDLMIDKNNQMWIATNQGVCVYNRELDRFEKPIPALVTSYVKTLIQDQSGNYWFGTGKQIYQFDSNYKLIQIHNQDLSENWIGNTSVLCLTQDPEGIIWIGTQERGIFSYNPRTKEKGHYEDQVSTKEFFTAVPDKSGNVWFGSNDSSYVYVIKDKKFYNLYSTKSPYHLPLLKLASVAQDEDGILWMGNWADGLTRFDIKNNTYETFVHDANNINSINNGSIEFPYIDKEGNIWCVGIASELNVIYKNRRNFKTITDNNFGSGIFKSPTTAIAKDTKDNFWFGTDGGGISLWNMSVNGFTNYIADPNNSKSYGGNSALTVFVDSKGRVWSGGYNSGLNLFNSETNDFIVFKTDNPPPYTISGKDIRDIDEDKQGRIWVTTNGGGISIYNPETFEYSIVNSLNSKISSDYCLSVMFDKKDRAFIATYKGLSIYNSSDNSVKKFFYNKNSTDSLPSNWVYCLFQDSKGRYWIGTALGLSLYNEETNTFKTYYESDGLANSTIMAITEDSNGKLWISTDNGLSRFDPEKEQFQNFITEDGLPNNQFRMGSVYKNSDGLLFFGSNKGVVYFNPKEILFNKTVPVIHFTNLFVNNKLIIPGKSRILSTSIDYLKKLRVRHNENFIRIDFVALSYFQADRNRYEYMLEGVDKEWVDCGTSTSANYTNLSSGRYTFMVRGYNNDGVPSEVKSIIIRVIPAWYKSKIFLLLIFILIAYLAYKYYKLYDEKNKKDKIFLEQKVKDANAELEQKIKEIESRSVELKKHDSFEKELRYQTDGVALFSDIIAQKRQNLSDLTTNIISELVNYIDANAGAIFIVDDSDTDSIVLRATGDFCFDSDAEKRYEFEAGEGYVGTCYKEKKTIQIDNLPDGFIVLRSGLGQTSLNHSLFVPIIHEMSCLGVIEIGSIKKLEQYVVKFVEKLAETVASVLAISKANEKTQEMLEQNRIQSEELHSQEEELRQNLEEMQATQEDLRRQMGVATKAQEAFEQEKNLIDTLLKNAKELIYFKDKQSRFLKASESMAKLFNVSSADEMVGKSDFDFFTEEHSRPAYEDEMRIIKTGIPIIDKIEKETHADGRVDYVSTTKMPLYDKSGQIIGTFGISKDVTDVINMEMEIKQRNEELMAQEEELRQNLEEMQTVQENLQAKIEENEKIQAELSKEKSLMDTLMNTIPEFIYFKDLDSKFIKNSQSHAKIFGYNSPKEIEGKSDFDFFDEEHARPAYEDEQNIIKTGKPIINLIEKEVRKDGTISYVSTTKMPLRDENDKIVGTFGISKDVSDIVNMEMEIKQRNEELMAQEEELRQNLEEMQTVQENLQAKIDENQKMQEELSKEKSLMDALMNSIPEYIYFKDLDSKFIKNSQSHAKVFGFNSPKDIVGKSDFDFFDRDHAMPAYEDEQNIIKTGKPIINLVEKEIKKDGTVSYVSTTKMPLRNDKDKIVGTFGISKDITEQVKSENELKEKNEMLLSQEEELRQNLEEMQTVQENLELQIEKNKSMQDELLKEKTLLDAIMNNLPDYIYFKDKDSKFIRISKSMLPLFPVKYLEEMIGKSDFDFQPKETAQKYFKDEMEIIKTGKSIINDVAHEIMDNGKEQWVSTTKMPLVNEQGECVGTFGISKDITELKVNQISSEQLAKSLAEREKELKKTEESLKKELNTKNQTIKELQEKIKKSKLK